jgi:hypothetical protein
MRSYSSQFARKQYWANKRYWSAVWQKRKQKEALQRGRYDPGCSVPDVSPRFYKIAAKPIPKYIQAYSDEELELILHFLNKSRKRARNLSYNAYTREVERTEHYYNLLTDEYNLRRYPRLRFMKEYDEECKMEISKFKSLCIYGKIDSYDGSGYYATAEMISNIPAEPAAICAGHIRTDFKYICWYNKVGATSTY